MNIYLQNTLSKKKEEFKPLKKDKVGMYNCGPTVYNYVHIGNLRSYIFSDILLKTLEYANYNVIQVMNITDIGHLTSDSDSGNDKMTNALIREKKSITLDSMKKLANFYTEAFKNNLITLNIKIPKLLPFASDYINDYIKLIKKLEKKGVVYQISDGLYFNIDKYPQYGKLGNINSSKLNKLESRINVNLEKKNSKDFALWKFNTKIGFESPWGRGFPGWHIECSAISMKYLGDTFDIHTGGIDHIPVHHNNEIAQSECATGINFVKYWLHNAFVNLNSKKMAKSSGNFLTLNDIQKRGFSPLSYRYFILQAHYRSPINFSWEALKNAQNSLEKLQNIIKEFPDGGNIQNEYKNKFEDAIGNDLDTPGAIAILWSMLRDKEIKDADKLATTKLFDSVLSLFPVKKKEEIIPLNIKNLVDERNKMRHKKDWINSDKLRKRITLLGYEVKDTDNGTKLYKI